MNGRILRLGGDEHDIVQLLLPWHDSGRLDAADTARVLAHLGGCARCQADLAWQRRLRGEFAKAADALQCDVAAADVDRGWAALRHRIEMEAAGWTQQSQQEKKWKRFSLPNASIESRFRRPPR